jgi:hypothetical protein
LGPKPRIPIFSHLTSFCNCSILTVLRLYDSDVPFDNSFHVKVPAFVCLGIPVERQAGWEERCAQGSLDSKLDQSPKSFGIS